MKAILVHHADAVGPQVDSQRPLSALGHEQASRVAAAIAANGLVPATVWHSGKLRSRQTAETMLRLCNPFAEFHMVRGLRPDDPPDWIRADLMADERDVLLVGHMPHIARLLRLLAPDSPEFPLHGGVVLEKMEDADGAEVTEWREILRVEA